MPYFLDLDFYSQASSSKSEIVNNAVLPVPAHLQTWRERLKMPNLRSTHHGIHLIKEKVDVGPTGDIFGTLIHDVSITVEAFESDDLPNSLETDVIPSSYPESDFNSQIHLDPDIIKCCLGEELTESKTSCFYKTRTETFTRIENKEKSHEFETPIMWNAFHQSLLKLLVNKTRLKSLDVLPAEDPLLKPDKSQWTEKDLFNDSHQKKPYVAPSYNNGPQEDFKISLVNKTVSALPLMDMDNFMLPMVKAKDRTFLVDNIHDLKALIKGLDCQQQHCLRIDDIAKVNYDNLNTGDVGVESLDRLDLSAFLAEKIDPPFDFKKEGTTQCYPTNDLGVDINKSPMFGFPSVKVSQRPDNVLNYFSDSQLKKTLDLFKFQDFLVECPLLTKKEFKKLKREHRESERHFDAERLLEPTLPKVELPDLYGRAKDLFPLSAEVDSLPYNKEVVESGSVQQLWCIEDPLKEIIVIGSDLKLPKPLPVEHYTKTSMLQKDDWSNETIDIWKETALPLTCNETWKDGHNSNSTPPQSDEKEESHRQGIEYFNDGDNPLENFMQFRSHNIQSNTAHKGKKLPKVMIKKEISEIENEVITETQSNDTTVSTVNIVKVSFTGPHEEVLKCLVDFVAPYLDKVKQKGHIPHQDSFYATSVDTLRFIWKENTVQSRTSKEMEHKCSTETSDISQSLLILLRVRQALHLLIHSCLPSAIHHISSFNNSVKGNGTIQSLQDRLLEFQYSIQQKKSLHPKFETLVNHLALEDQHKTKTLIMVQQGLLSLVSELERILKERIPCNVQFAMNLEDVNSENLQTSCAVITFEPPINKTSLELFDLIIQFDASSSTVVQKLCKEMGKKFLGLVTEYNPALTNIMMPAEDKLFTKLKHSITVIGSVEMMQHRQLIYILEARHNILFIERNYTSLQFSQTLHYADIIFSLEVSLVLLPLLELGMPDWDMEAFTKRVIAVGLQTHCCFILVHGIGAPSKYSLDKFVLQNLYRLRSSLFNLSHSSASFVTQYKVLVALTQEDVAINVNAVAEYSVSKSPSDTDERKWLKADISQDEACLLQMVCLNSFSAQLLLSKLNLEDILTMRPKQAKEIFPYFSDTVLMYIHHLTYKLKSDQMSSSSCSSQASARSTSQKSACSSSSNPTSDLMNMPLTPKSLCLPSQTRENLTILSKHDVSKSTNHIQVKNDKSNYILDEFHNDKHPVRIKRENRDDSTLNRVLERLPNNIVYTNSDDSYWRRHDRDVDVSISGQQNRDDINCIDQQKRVSLIDKENSYPNKRVCGADSTFDTNRPTRQHLAYTENVMNASDWDDTHQSKIHERKAQRSNIEYSDIDICTDPKPMSNLYMIREKADLVDVNNAVKRNHYFGEKVDNFKNIDNHNSTSMQDNVLWHQQDKNPCNEDKSQELFFLGQSQNFHHQTTTSVNNVYGDDDNPIILVKSQEPQFHQSYSDANMNLSGSDIVNSLFSDPKDETNNLAYTDTNSLSSALPTVFDPLPLSTTKPPSISDNLRLNTPSNRRSPLSQSNTPSSFKYGIFSAKVGRKVNPMPVAEAQSYPRSTLYDHQNLPIAQDLTASNSDLQNQPFYLPDVTQLPFSVSWDLRKHIKQTDSNVFRKTNKMDSGMNGATYNDRITRVPNILRNQANAQEREIDSSAPIQDILQCANTSSENNGLTRAMFLSNKDNKDEQDQNIFNTTRHYSVLEEINKESIEQSDQRLDLHGNDYRDSTGNNLKFVKPLSRSSQTGRDNRQNEISTNNESMLNIQHHGQSLASCPGNPRENQFEPYLYDINYTTSNHSSRGNNVLPSMPSVAFHETQYDENGVMFGNISTNMNSNTKYYFPQNVTQYQVNPFKSQQTLNESQIGQGGSLKPHFTMSNNESFNPQHIDILSREVNRDNRRMGYQRMHYENQPLQKINLERNVQDIETRNLIKPNEAIHRNNTSCHRDIDIGSNFNDKSDRHYDRSFCHANIINSSSGMRNPTLQGSMDRYKGQTIMSRAEVQGDSLSDHQGRNNTLIDCRTRGKDNLPQQPPPTNVLKLYNLPYTPRRNISVGLAQPLQRSQENKNRHSAGPVNQHGPTTFPVPASQNDASTLKHYGQIPPVHSSHSTTTRASQFPSSASPPMDFGDAFDNQHQRDGREAFNSANKMKKWNKHLQRHAAQRFESEQKSALFGESNLTEKYLCSLKKPDSATSIQPLIQEQTQETNNYPSEENLHPDRRDSAWKREMAAKDRWF